MVVLVADDMTPVINLWRLGQLRPHLLPGVRVPTDLRDCWTTLSAATWRWLLSHDVPRVDVVRPRLTTMAQPTELIDRQTVRLVLARLAAPICLHAVS